MPIAADVTPAQIFQRAANSAAAIYASPPPFVTYHVTTHASASGLVRDTADERTVMVRTADDRAIVTDVTVGGTVATGPSFPMPPIFDPLARFGMKGTVTTAHGLDNFHVSNVVPYEFRKREAGDGNQPDVEVISVRNYTAAFAEPPAANEATPVHLVLAPTAVYQAAHPSFAIHDVYVDQKTLLPTRVDYVGPNFTMNVQYAPVEGHWVVHSFDLQSFAYGPMRLSKTVVSISAVYDAYTFPATAPDPRLAS
jgi:hypothetical protein